MSSADLSRRSFVAATGSAVAALAGLPQRILADPYAPLPALPRRSSPLRVRGRVTVTGRAASGVAVSDGHTVALTARDGSYSLLSSTDRPWVSVSLPSGCRIPTTQTGTARLHQPIVPDTRGEATARFDFARAEESDTRHRFVVLADTQTQDAYEMARLHAETVPEVKKAVADGRAGQCLGIACGDIMFDELTLYPDYERAVAAMGIPFLQVVGNHDLNFEARTSETATRTFERHFGPPWYSLNVGEIHYVVLNDVLWYGDGYLGYLTAEQLAWLAADLAVVERGRTVVVALHIPVGSTRWQRTGERDEKRSETLNNKEALLRLLEPYRAHIVSGHTHEMEHVTFGTTEEHVLGTACGAWWSGDICHDGTPNGFGLFDVDGSDLRWTYRSTGKPADFQMHLYPPGADPKAPDEIVANVWSWDPRWSVVWYANGERRGSMARRVGLDPRAVTEQTGSDLPPRRKWVEPTMTGHLFYATPSPDAREIVVEATDPWGRKFTERLQR